MNSKLISKHVSGRPYVSAEKYKGGEMATILFNRFIDKVNKKYNLPNVSPFKFTQDVFSKTDEEEALLSKEATKKRQGLKQKENIFYHYDISFNDTYEKLLTDAINRKNEESLSNLSEEQIAALKKVFGPTAISQYNELSESDKEQTLKCQGI